MAGVRVSPREAEVLAAVGEYLTNPEIAARLYISTRTVESHVSSLLHKLGVSDRRALAAVAAQAGGPAPSEPADAAPVTARAPFALTPLVGRAEERGELVAALGTHRLVNAVGPGGVGKTRLALAAAEDVGATFEDGTRYVDLVPVADDAMVAPAVAAALGLAEQSGRVVEETIATWAADRKLLLVLDNCEHVVNGVVTLVERLLGRSLGLTVLTTSRVRLMLPFEQVFPVGGLRPGDAGQLFTERASAGGAVIDDPGGERVARICAALDGVPLAIELAAARVAAVGLDGLQAGLVDQLGLLTGSRRVDDRHRSLRSALDWSFALLDDDAKSVLRGLSVFAGSFTVAAVAAVVQTRGVVGAVATLVDHHLVATVPSGAGTRHGLLESVRQYAAERLEAAGQEDGCRSRHLAWCHAEGAALLATGADTTQLRTRFEEIADELRRALGWARTRPEHRADAHRVATLLAALCHRRGLPAEAQRRSEQAAELADSDVEAALALHLAAGSALARLGGDDAIRLHRAAAAAELRAGRPTRAARELARVVELTCRSSGIVTDLPDPVEQLAILDEARRLAADDPVALARVAIAEAFNSTLTVPVAEHALELAIASADPIVESAALDGVTVAHLFGGDVQESLAAALRRTGILAGLPSDAELGMEAGDAYGMGTDCAVAAGDLATAMRMAQHCRDLPVYRELGHLATARLIIVTGLTGDWAAMRANSIVFLDAWEMAGRPRLSTLRRVAMTVASVCGIRGDVAEQARWSELIEALTPAGRGAHDPRIVEFFDGMVLLHHGRHEEAIQRLAVDPQTGFRTLNDAIWRPWHAGLQAEAAVLAGRPDAAAVLDATRAASRGNPVAEALVDRAAALAAGDRSGVLGAAQRLKAAGCHYQWARGLVLAGGAEAEVGAGALAEMGAG